MEVMEVLMCLAGSLRVQQGQPAEPGDVRARVPHVQLRRDSGHALFVQAPRFQATGEAQRQWSIMWGVAL